MKVQVLEKKVICSNPDNQLHGYFAWPSVARLQDGRLMMAASGFRMKHICPFGKVVACYSDDEGRTWTKPSIIIDTPLDDRDAGVVPFGEQSVLVTSFNNTVWAQRNWNAANQNPYINAYLDSIDEKAAEEKYLGSTFVISHDGGRTFGEVMRIPVTCPHGPVPMKDGSLLYIGRTFSASNKIMEDDHVAAYRLNADGTYEKLGDIENVAEDLLSCEPHTIILPDGKIIVHIRVQKRGYFTTYQSESSDGGMTFTKPRQLLGDQGGAPAHLLRLDDGTLISVYGYREEPYGIRMMYSKDDGETWSTDHVLWDEGPGNDLGYPASVQLNSGEILTVFYASEVQGGPTVIHQIRWRFDAE